MGQRLYYFGIPFDHVDMAEAISQSQSFLNDGQQHYVTTPNPEMVVRATRDESFAQALRGSSLALIDGVGLQLVFFLLDRSRVPRVPGTDYLEALVKTVGEKYSFFFLGGQRGVGRKAADTFYAKYGTHVVGTYEPRRGAYDVREAIRVAHEDEHQRILKKIQQAKPDILVVALGHGLQEKWIAAFLAECPSVRLAIGVGGALDFLSGDVKRAPARMRRSGLEWFWRLLAQPWRIGRIFTAVVMFPITAASWYLSSRLRYRPSVVGCLINNEGKILLVSRSDDRTHWQLPQGGQEKGETPHDAIRREMREELGTDKMEIIGQSKADVYRYSWKRTKGIPRVDKDSGLPIRLSPYRGQRQTIFYLRFLGKDRDIKLDPVEHADWKWIEPSHLIAVIHPFRRTLASIVTKELNAYYHD